MLPQGVNTLAPSQSELTVVLTVALLVARPSLTVPVQAQTSPEEMMAAEMVLED